MESTVSVKVSFNGEMRRFPFQGTSFAVLQEHIIELLGLEKTAEITLKYADEENDLITISSDLELKSAIMPGQLLRLEATPKRAAVQPFVAQPVVPQSAPPMQVEGATPLGGDLGWSYHHGHRTPFAGNDWHAFKELRKKDKKAFSREEWASFKELRKNEKKALKEHLKEQKEWHKKEKKECGNWRGSHPHHHGPHGHHGVPPYFGPHGMPHHPHPHPHPYHGQHAPHGSQEGDREVTMSDVPIDERTADHQPPSPLGVHHPPFAHMPPPFGGHQPPFGFPHHPHPHPHGPFGFPPGFGPGCGGANQPTHKLVARHVKDVTVEDGMQVAASSPFVKTWRVRNEGAPWPAGCALLFLNKHGGDSMSAPERVLVEGPVATNQEVDISVSLIAPAKPGRYTGYWKMCSPDGRKFGQRMWVTIVVPSLGSSSEGEKEADRYESLVDSVLAMGFDVKRHRVFRLLQKHNGDVALVCQALSDKAAKAAQKDAEKAHRRSMKDAGKAHRDAMKAQHNAMKD